MKILHAVMQSALAARPVDVIRLLYKNANDLIEHSQHDNDQTDLIETLLGLLLHLKHYLLCLLARRLKHAALLL